MLNLSTNYHFIYINGNASLAFKFILSYIKAYSQFCESKKTLSKFFITYYIGVTYSQDQTWVLLNYDLYA